MACAEYGLSTFGIFQFFHNLDSVCVIWIRKIFKLAVEFIVVDRILKVLDTTWSSVVFPLHGDETAFVIFRRKKLEWRKLAIICYGLKEIHYVIKRDCK